MTNQCLNSPEILRLIFDRLIWKKHTLSAALTCRSFLEPALDSMWHEIEIRTILGCLPPDLLEYREESYEHGGGLRKVKVAVSPNCKQASFFCFADRNFARSICAVS
jgi:hypothetical protein